MKKSNIIILSAIAILIILGGIGIWRWESGKRSNSSIENINQKQELQKETTAKDNISEEDLVWYEIPELGIRFKVTPDAKEDLRYQIIKGRDSITNDDYISAWLYLQSVYDFLGKDRCDSNDDSGNECSEKVISRHPAGHVERNKANNGPDVGYLIKNDKYEIELLGRQSVLLKNDEAERYNKILEDQGKNLGYFQDKKLIEEEYNPFNNVEFIK